MSIVNTIPETDAVVALSGDQRIPFGNRAGVLPGPQRNPNAMIKTFSIDGGAGVDTYNLAVYTPEGAAGDLPAFIFIPGFSEFGTDVNNLYVNSPFHYIRAGWEPPFIVAAAQPPRTFPSGRLDAPLFMRAVLRELLDKPYGIDRNRLYFTGIGAGAGIIYHYVQAETDALFRAPAAIIPVSMGVFASSGDYSKATDSLSGNDARFFKIPFLGYCDGNDKVNSLQPMARFIVLLGQAGGMGSVITYMKRSEDSPRFLYDPNGLYKIYNRALQYNTGPMMPNPAKTVISISATYTYSDGSSETIRTPKL